MRTKSLAITMLVLGIAVLAVACLADEPEAQASVAGARAIPLPATASPATPTLPLAGQTRAARPQVIASDQFVRDGMVIVDQAVAPEEGWVVIHDTLPDGAPGEVIGRARIGAQLNLQIPVQLEVPIDEPTQLVAMLHRSTGDADSFDFPDGDPPFVENGRPVLARFLARPSD